MVVVLNFCGLELKPCTAILVHGSFNPLSATSLVLRCKRPVTQPQHTEFCIEKIPRNRVLHATASKQSADILRLQPSKGPSTSLSNDLALTKVLT